MYKRIFDTNELPAWLEMHKPWGCEVRKAKNDNAYIIQGPKSKKKAIDEYVDKMCSD